MVVADRSAEIDAISQLKVRYCWAADDPDTRPMLDLFAPGGTYVSQREGECVGHAQIAAQLATSRGQLHVTQHVVSNGLIDLGEDGTTATGRWYFAIHLFDGDASAAPVLDRMIYGEYHDEFVKIEGRWLFERLEPRTTGMSTG